MRASFPLMVAFALAAYTAPCRAQTPDKPGAPVTSAAGAPTSSKASPNATETGHIDALSPDEARRIERVRAKAAAKAQPIKPQPVKSEAPAESRPAPPASAEPATTRATAEPRPPRPAARAVSTPKAMPAVPRAAERAAVPPDGPPPKEAAAPPAAAPRAMRDAHAAERPDGAAQPHPFRRAARLREVPSRATAAVEPRRGRQRYDATAMRRSRGEFAERGMPRVGEVLPPDVPLYPMPPGYGPPRGYPPFPRSRAQVDYDDYPPPRRGFMAPY